MSSGTYVSFTGADAAMHALEIVANNVANANTAGFRRDTTLFDSVLAANMPFVEAQNGTIDLSPGTLRQTNNPLHAALQSGDTFFVVEGKDGSEQLTRRGDFRLDGQGRLVLPNGLPVLGTSGALSVPAGTQARLDGKGRLMSPDGEIGRLRVVRLEDATGLEKVGGNTLRPPAGANLEDVAEPNLAVGAVEQSNVKLASEMVAMMQAARSFEASIKAMQVQDQTSEQLIQAQS